MCAQRLVWPARRCCAVTHDGASRGSTSSMMRDASLSLSAHTSWLSGTCRSVLTSCRPAGAVSAPRARVAQAVAARTTNVDGSAATTAPPNSCRSSAPAACAAAAGWCAASMPRDADARMSGRDVAALVERHNSLFRAASFLLPRASSCTGRLARWAAPSPGPRRRNWSRRMLMTRLANTVFRQPGLMRASATRTPAGRLAATCGAPRPRGASAASIRGARKRKASDVTSGVAANSESDALC